MQTLIEAPERLRRPERELCQRAALEYLHFYTVFVLGYDLLTPAWPDGLHWNMCRTLHPPIGKPRAYICFRGSYKTTTVTISRPLWMACRDPVDYDALFITTDEGLGLDNLHSITRHVDENETLHQIFPNVQGERGRWGSGRYRLRERRLTKKGGTWELRTLGQGWSGRHVSSIHFDDLTNDANYDSREIQNTISTRLELAWPMLKSNEKFFTMTPYTDYDSTAWLLEHYYPHRLEVFLFPVRGRAWIDPQRHIEIEDPKRHVYADPWAWDDERYDEARKNYSDPAFFASQFWLQTRTKDAFSFRMEWIKRIRREDLPLITTYLALDPASGQGPSQAAVSVVGVDLEGHVYPVEQVSGFTREAQSIEAFFQAGTRWAAASGGIECYGGGVSTYQRCENYMRDNGVYLYLEKITGSNAASKDERNRMALWPLYQQGMVYHPYDLQGGDLEDQLDNYGPRAKHKDQVDALRMAVNLAKTHGYRGARPGEQKTARRRNRLGIPRGYTLQQIMAGNDEEPDDATVALRKYL